MFFIDDDQAEIGQGRENGQAGAEHDARRTVERGAPVARARGLGQFAVQTGESGLRKAGGDARLQLRCQVDFRHQQQGLLSGRQRALDEAQIDLGLAAAGDAVQEIGAEGVVIRTTIGGDPVECGLLLCRERRTSLCRQVFGDAPCRACLGRIDPAQAGWQGRDHHFAERRLVVGGAELAQAEPVRRQRRQVAQNAFNRFELRRRKIAACR